MTRIKRELAEKAASWKVSLASKSEEIVRGSFKILSSGEVLPELEETGVGRLAASCPVLMFPIC